MRLFLDQEKEIIKELVAAKSKGIAAIQDLQTAKILRQKFNFFALKWTRGDKPQISIYYHHIEADDEQEEIINQLYYDIADFIYFIKELESLGFIAIQSLSVSDKEKDYDLLFDRKKYRYDEVKNEFRPLKEDESLNDIFKNAPPPFEKISDDISVLLQIDRRDVNLDFANELKRYGLGIIYPLPLAVDYVKKECKTLEQTQFEEQVSLSQKQLDSALDSAKSSRRSMWIACGSFVVALIALIITMCTSNEPTTIDRDDLQRIESAIQSNHLSEPLQVYTNDTLIVTNSNITQTSK